MATTVQRDGRTWSVNKDGINSLKRKYTIILDTNNLSANGELTSFSGVPAIGSAHPIYSDLSVVSYDVTEGSDSEKKLVNVVVNYSVNGDDTAEDSSLSGEGVIEKWTWDMGTEQREVTNNLFDGQNKDGALLNSAGDPFQNVPQCEAPAPVFTKIVKTTSRKDWMKYNCKINQNSISIGSMSCAQKTLLACISEEKIFGDDKWKYRYTINLKYRSNMSMYGAGTTPIEFGWDIPVVDAGMRELDTNDGNKPKIIMQVDGETNQPCAVTSAELLDGSGHKAERVNGKASPYIIRVQAYEKDTFPSELYSE